MTQNRVERKLVAILAVDVVSYVRHVEADEEGSYARLKSLREQLINPIVASHGGRTVTLAGDGALIEFPSIVDAVTCAIECQRAIAHRNTNLPEIERMAVRIGINLGDVIVEDGDIHGRGVHVAALLVRVASPGGILISSTAYDQAEGRVDCDFAFIGEKELRNIERPVRVYQVLIDGAEAGTNAEQRPPGESRSDNQGKIFLAHASEDKLRIRRLHDQLKSRGFDPWLDEVDLLPGQIWKEEIPKAIAGAKVFLACLSSQSAGKVGYVQTEFRRALAAFGRHPPGSIFLIPVRLDDCSIPDLTIPDLALGLKDIQWVDLFDEDGFDRLILAIQRALGEGTATAPVDPPSNSPQHVLDVPSLGQDLAAPRILSEALAQPIEGDVTVGPPPKQLTRKLRAAVSHGGGTRYSDLKIDLWDDPTFRRECAAKLKGTQWGELYRETLGNAIAWSDQFFGAPLSYRALGTCFIIAFVYGYFGLSIAYILGGPGIWISPELMPRLGSVRDNTLNGIAWLAATTLAWLIGYGSGRFERRRRKYWLQTKRRQAGEPIKPIAGVGYHLRSAAITIGIIGICLSLIGFADSDPIAFLMRLFQMPVLPAVLLLVTALAMKARGVWAGPLALLGGAMASLVLSGIFVTSVTLLGPSGMLVVAVGVTILVLVGTILATGVVLAPAAPLAAILMLLGIAEAISQVAKGGNLVIVGETFSLTRGETNTITFVAAWVFGASQGYWPIKWRLGWAAAVGFYLTFGVLGAAWAIGDEHRFVILAGMTLFTMLPLLNGLLDMVSWLWTRWLAGRLYNELLKGTRVEARVATVLGHTFADLVLAVIALVLLAWLLAFAFELYGQAGLAGPINADLGSYVLPMIDDAMMGPWQNGLWVWLMLLSTLVPTMIHMIFLLVAPLAVVALPDRRRYELVERLEAFDHASRDEQTTTVRKVATYITRERRVIWIAAAACMLIGPAGLMFIFVYLTDWQPFGYVASFLYEVALNAIGSALFLTGR